MGKSAASLVLNGTTFSLFQQPYPARVFYAPLNICNRPSGKRQMRKNLPHCI